MKNMLARIIAIIKPIYRTVRMVIRAIVIFIMDIGSGIGKSKSFNHKEVLKNGLLLPNGCSSVGPAASTFLSMFSSLLLLSHWHL